MGFEVGKRLVTTFKHDSGVSAVRRTHPLFL